MRRLALLAVLLPQLAVAHQGHTSSLPWDACDARTLGEVCTFEPTATERHIGTCRAMSGDLVCVRNRPIVAPDAVAAGTVAAGTVVTPGALATVGALAVLYALLPGWARRFRRSAPPVDSDRGEA